MFVVVDLLLLESSVEVLGDDLLDTGPVLSSQGIELAVAPKVHVVGPDIAPDLGVLVVAFEAIPLRVAVVLEGDGIVGESGLDKGYPPLLPVRFIPRSWSAWVVS